MAGVADSSCANHPGVPATVRCKQCNKPLCNACRIASPYGWFCSEECREKYEHFAQKAEELDKRERARPVVRWYRIRQYVVKVVLLAVAVLFLTYVAGLMGYHIPFLSDLLLELRDRIGL